MSVAQKLETANIIYSNVFFNFWRYVMLGLKQRNSKVAIELQDHPLKTKVELN